MLIKLLKLMPLELMVIAADIRIIYQSQEQAAEAVADYYQSHNMTWADLVVNYWH